MAVIDYLFFNRQKKKLTRAGITYVIDKNVALCQEKYPEFTQEEISPHTFRHLLKNGLPFIYIRDFLGHQSVMTTEVYAKTNPTLLAQAIEKHSQQLEINPSLKNTSIKESVTALLKKIKQARSK